jgi:protein gp37
MGAKSKIEWTDATWNPIRGCTRISQGCYNCYAEAMAARFSGPGQPYEGFAIRCDSGPRWTNKVALVESELDRPLHWRRPRRIFTCSMSDLFHPAVNDQWLVRVFCTILAAGEHTFLILTKRPERMQRWITEHTPKIWHAAGFGAAYGPLPNVWLGVSVEDQKTFDERVRPVLLTPAAVRFISYEPALGPLDARNGFYIPNPVFPRQASLDWVICGGESGPGARPMHLNHAREVRDQCKAAGVPFFMKQVGRYPVFDRDETRGFIRDRKGGDWDEWPADLRVREFPQRGSDGVPDQRDSKM